MSYSYLFMLMDETKLSFEQLGERLGVSGMTLRRWRQHPPAGDLPKIYQTALIDATYQLIIDGTLAPDAQVVQTMLQVHPNLSIGAALKNLGLSADSLQRPDAAGGDRIVEALAMIGLHDERQSQIAGSSSLLNYFQKISSEWKDKISLLRRVIGSTQLSTLDKLVAYGALFYLITPFDLIPDYIPVFGLIDDYGVLAIAAAYYVRLAARLGTTQVIDEPLSV